MQETHLKKREVTDILSTLLNFNPLESELILFKDSKTDTNTFRVRYHQLKAQGHICGTYSFHHSSNPEGTTIVRTK
jgi:hypothetical protein